MRSSWGSITFLFLYQISLTCVYSWDFSNFTQWPETCKGGQNSLQSPIDFSKSLREPCKIQSFQFNFSFLDSFSSFQLDSNYSAYIDQPPIFLNASHIDSTPTLYELSEIHFFAPSGHTFFSFHADLEMNLVFSRVASNQTKDQSTYGKFAVVSLFFNRALDYKYKWNYTTGASEEDPSYNQTKAFFDKMSFSGDFIEAFELGAPGTQLSFKFKDLFAKPLQECSRYYIYKGSWTSPPCNQNVNWYVQDYIYVLSPKYYEVFNKAWIANKSFSGGRGRYRDTQEPGVRTVCSLNLSKFAGRYFLFYGTFILFFLLWNSV